MKNYLASTLYYRGSHQIDPGRLERLVIRLREGDKSVIATIIRGHLRLVASIVGKRARNPAKREDAFGAALLALVEAVNNAGERLFDNNITPYITSCVRYAIKESLANDHTVRMPSRTVRYRIAQGEKFEEIVPGDTCEVNEGSGDHGSGTELNEGLSTMRGKGSFTLPYVIPIAKPFEPSPEFKEAVARAATTPMETAIFKLKMEGWGYEDIGKKVGLSYQRIGQIVPLIVTRFEALIK